MKVLDKKEKEIYENIVKNIVWKKIKVPVDKDPFGDDKW